MLRADTFKIKATNGSYPGDIRSITVAPGVSGEVDLSVITETGGVGANGLGWIDLTNATVGNINDVRVWYLGEQVDAEETHADAVTGAFRPHEIRKDVHVQRVTAEGSIGHTGEPSDLTFLLADLYIHDAAATNPGTILVNMDDDSHTPHSVFVAGSLTGVFVLQCCG